MSRVEFSNPIKRAAYTRSGGLCECFRVPQLNRPKGCGLPVGEGNTFYEHITQDFFSHDNALENCAVLTKSCWREKTKIDLRVIPKSKRVADRSRGIRRATSRPFPGGKNSPLKKKVSGEVVRR
jgi:hypothetical protein